MNINLKKACLVAALLPAIFAPVIAQTTSKPAQIEERNVLAHMEFLASDALQGRGSGTPFELLGGKYIASQLQQFGVLPSGDADATGNPGFIQTVTITRNTFSEAPKLSYSAGGTQVSLEHGKEMLVSRMTAAQISGELQKVNLDGKPKSGAVVFITLRDGDDPQKLGPATQAMLAGGAAAVIYAETPQLRARWAAMAGRGVGFTVNSASAAKNAVIVLSADAAKTFLSVPDGTPVEIKGTLAPPQVQQTYNVIGKIPGTDSARSKEVILLSAHMDHLGVRPNAPGDDKIYNGADDDASGCIAVLELARVLMAEKAPKRTVYFAFFGSEEAGGYGAQYFVNNLPFAKADFVANLEFEMIGRPDPMVAADELWLTGYDRSNLGAELAKRGAKIVNDPHPEQNFFQRSDNITLARQGIIAHTVSSYGLHKDYHQASDEIKTIDFAHMTRSINSMVAPVEWLVNTDFRPEWYEGKKP